MGIVEKCFPSFLKVMCCDFRTKLQVPPEAVKDFEKGPLSQKFILRTNHPGALWLVKMEKIENNYFFSSGWMEFAVDHSLETGDSLVFLLLDKSEFEVLLYDKSGFPKKFNSGVNIKAEHLKSKKPRDSAVENEEAVRRSHGVKVESGREEEDDDIVRPEHPHFVTKLKKYNKYYLNVPKGFATETGILLKNKVVLKNTTGRTWKVEIHNDRKVDFRSGWLNFLKGNNLVEGDVCMFEFIHRNMIKVHISRNGEGGGGYY